MKRVDLIYKDSFVDVGLAYFRKVKAKEDDGKAQFLLLSKVSKQDVITNCLDLISDSRKRILKR